LSANPDAWVGFLVPQDRERVQAAFSGLMADEPSLDVSYGIVRPDGEVRSVRARGFQVRDAAGTLVRLIGTVTDITDHTRASDALRESEERFAGAFEHAPIGVALTAPDGRWLKVNRALCELVGYTEAELLTRTFQGMTHPDDLASDLERMRRLMAGDVRAYQMEKRYLHADGHFVTVLLNVSLVRDAVGAPRYFIAQIQDITERKLAEQALRTSTEEFRALTEAMPQIVWFTRADGWTVYINHRWTEYTGLSTAEGLGRGWNKSFHPGDDERGFREWQAAVETGGTFSFECRMRRADGEYRWWLIRGMPMRDSDGVITRWCGTCTDIHDMKLAELEISRTNLALQAEVAERARAEDAADAANRAKSEFLANMSHEIRTPLNGVIGMTELVLDSELTTEQRESLEMVQASGQSLLIVIDDILDFSKIEAGQLSIDIIPFDLNDCVATTLKLLAARAHLKGLELACAIGADVPTGLLGDPSRLRQIITNLVGNAVKFTDHGEVVLTIAVLAHTDRAVLRFSVSDTGIGVPLERQAAIFKPFIQADGSTTRKYGGTGLGLAISTNLVGLLGGRIWRANLAGAAHSISPRRLGSRRQRPALRPARRKCGTSAT
jgi:PAS domain S-box-containing protein